MNLQVIFYLYWIEGGLIFVMVFSLLGIAEGNARRIVRSVVPLRDCQDGLSRCVAQFDEFSKKFEDCDSYFAYSSCLDQIERHKRIRCDNADDIITYQSARTSVADLLKRQCRDKISSDLLRSNNEKNDELQLSSLYPDSTFYEDTYPNIHTPIDELPSANYPTSGTSDNNKEHDVNLHFSNEDDSSMSFRNIHPRICRYLHENGESQRNLPPEVAALLDQFRSTTQKKYQPRGYLMTCSLLDQGARLLTIVRGRLPKLFNSFPSFNADQSTSDPEEIHLRFCARGTYPLIDNVYLTLQGTITDLGLEKVTVILRQYPFCSGHVNDAVVLFTLNSYSEAFPALNHANNLEHLVKYEISRNSTRLTLSFYYIATTVIIQRSKVPGNSAKHIFSLFFYGPPEIHMPSFGGPPADSICINGCPSPGVSDVLKQQNSGFFQSSRLLEACQLNSYLRGMFLDLCVVRGVLSNLSYHNSSTFSYTTIVDSLHADQTEIFRYILSDGIDLFGEDYEHWDQDGIVIRSRDISLFRILDSNRSHVDHALLRYRYGVKISSANQERLYSHLILLMVFSCVVYQYLSVFQLL